MNGQTLIDKAILFANEKHKGMVRKGDGQPYIFHPIEVLGVASLLTKDEDVLCAAVLHDTVEDTNTTKEEIEKEFNKHIAELVANESEDKRNDQSREATWKARKQEAIDTINNSKDIGTKIICLSDKVSNLRSFNRLVLQDESKAWDNFNMKDPLMHYWYYNELKKALVDLKDSAVYKEYCFLVDAIFNRYVKEK